MIDGKELRQGNYVQSVISHFKLTVIAILPDRVLYDGEPCSGARPNYEIEGIPLTEEILLKCGFRDECPWAINYEMLEFTYDDEKRLHMAWGKGDFHVVGRNIQFLHELQNIYYWLSGKKELEVKL